MSGLDDSVEGIRARFDLVEGLVLGSFGRTAYQSMLAQSGRVVRRPFYADDAIHMPPFAIRLPEARLLEIIGSKKAEATLDANAGEVSTYSGMAARDGSESYSLSHVGILFEEYSRPARAGTDPVRPTNFMFYFDIRVGRPIPETFVQSSPADRTRQRFWASIQVVWERVWLFFVAPTKAFSAELRERVKAGHGFDIGPSPYTVSARE